MQVASPAAVQAAIAAHRAMYARSRVQRALRLALRTNVVSLRRRGAA